MDLGAPLPARVPKAICNCINHHWACDIFQHLYSRSWAQLFLSVYRFSEIQMKALASRVAEIKITPPQETHTHTSIQCRDLQWRREKGWGLGRGTLGYSSSMTMGPLCRCTETPQIIVYKIYSHSHMYTHTEYIAHTLLHQ